MADDTNMEACPSVDAGSPSTEPNDDAGKGGGVRVGRLDSVDGVMVELGRVYRQVRRNAGPDIDPAVGSKLTYILTALARTIETSQLEQRVQALEERLRKK